MFLLSALFLYFGFNADFGYVNGSEWWKHFTFHFVHGNVFHYAVNAMALYTILFYRHDNPLLWPIAYVTATALSFVAYSKLPTVGFSATLFVYYGMICSMGKEIQWRSILTSLAYMVITLLVRRNIAIVLHFVSLFSGVLIGLGIESVREQKALLNRIDRIRRDND